MTIFQILQAQRSAADARDAAERAAVQVAMLGLSQARRDLARAKAERQRREDEAAARMMERRAALALR